MSEKFLSYLDETYQETPEFDPHNPDREPDEKILIGHSGIIKGCVGVFQTGDNLFNYLHLHSRRKFKSAMRHANWEAPQILEVYFNNPIPDKCGHAVWHIWLPGGARPAATSIEVVDNNLCKIAYPAGIDRPGTMWFICGWLFNHK